MSQGQMQSVERTGAQAAAGGGVVRAAGGDLWLATRSLWQREMVRFFRQRNRVIGALATPLVFWLLLGVGLNESFRPPMPGATPDDGAAGEVGYLAYFFPGMVVLVVLFTAIFSTISVIEDRREGFLQAVLAAPVSRLAIVLGKVLGGASIATIQAVILLALWPLLGPMPSLGALAGAVGILFLLGVGLTGLGLCIAWPMDSTAGFHAVMNLFLMPMWFLSGAVFPVDGVPGWMGLLMRLNPLTYGHAAFAGVLAGGENGIGSAWALPGGALWLNLLVTAGFTVGVVLLAGRLVSRPRKDGLA